MAGALLSSWLRLVVQAGARLVGKVRPRVCRRVTCRQDQAWGAPRAGTGEVLCKQR